MGFSGVYEKVNDTFSNLIKVIIGLAAIAAAVIIAFVTDFSYDYNAIVSIIAEVGLLSLVNALFSKVYRISFSYPLFMIVNAIGLMLYLFVISKNESIGSLFTILFSFIVFLALWVFEMCILNGAGLSRRILGGLLVNLVVIISILIAAVGMTSISVIKDML